MYVAPKSTEVIRAWGNSNTINRNTTSTTDGVANTNTLYGFGSAAHPAAYYCRALTTGGYNTWYLPAKNELITCWTNHLATPFATSNAFLSAYWSSTESNTSNAWYQDFLGGNLTTLTKTSGNYVRATRRSTV